MHFCFFCPVFLFFAVITFLLSFFPLLLSSPDLLCPTCFLSSSLLPYSLFICFFYSLFLTTLTSLLFSHLIHLPISSFPLYSSLFTLLVCLLFCIPCHILAFPLISSSFYLPYALNLWLLILSSFLIYFIPACSSYLTSTSPISKNFLSVFLCYKIWIMNDNSTIVLTETPLKSQPD